MSYKVKLLILYNKRKNQKNSDNQKFTDSLLT